MIRPLIALDPRRRLPQGELLPPGAWLIGATHMALIAVPGLFALDLLMTPRMFATLPNFAAFESLAPERVWAVALLLVCGLSVAGWRSRVWGLRCSALFALGTAHWLIALCFLRAGTFSTGTTTYPVLAAVAWCFAWDAYRAR